MSLPISSFASLSQNNVVNLTTFRKNGTPVATPVWFAESAGVIYVYTGATSGKVKRIRNSSRVTLAPSTASGKVTGEAIEARARIMNDDPQEIACAEALLAQKYGVQRRILYFIRSCISTIRRQTLSPAYLAIEI
jgi:uncharacterized protein